jgi:hypothetical protein
MPSFNVTPFNSGLQRGLLISYFDPANIADLNAELRLDEWYERGMIAKIGSIEMFSQAGRLVVTDKLTNMKRYCNRSTMTNYVVNTKAKRLDILYSNTSGVIQPVQFDITIYETVQPTFANTIVLP